MKKQKYMYGGIVNKNPEHDNFDSIVKLINNEKCQITCISYSSIKGFVFKLHVNDLLQEEVEFYGLNEKSNVFDSPIDTLVIKMAILYTGENIKDDKVLELPDYVSKMLIKKNKQLERFKDFKNEAIVQSEIYEKTLLKGQPICPALVDFSHFTSLDSSIPFLNAIEKRCVDEESKNMIRYIKNILGSVRNCELGMITMESAVTFDSFYDVYDNYGVIDTTTLAISGNGNAPSDKQVLLSNDVIVQIIRLLNECRIIHCDLHGYNVMVKKIDGSSKHKVFIIDFGRILNIDKLTKNEKKITQQYASDLFNERSFFKADFELSPKIKSLVTKFDKNYVKTLILFILSVDYMYNNLEFGVISQSKIQKTYINNIDKLKSYTAITNALNNYYSTNINCSIHQISKYKTVKGSDMHEKNIGRFETLCDKIKETDGSPSKYKFMARDAPELVRRKRPDSTSSNPNSTRKNKRTRQSSSGNRTMSNRSPNSFPNIIGRFDFSDSSSGSK